MTIAAAILGILAALTPLIIQWVRRRWEKKDTPQTRYEEQHKENREAVASMDPARINELLDRRINSVRAQEDPSVDGKRSD